MSSPLYDGAEQELLRAYWAAQAQFGPFDKGPYEFVRECLYLDYMVMKGNTTVVNINLKQPYDIYCGRAGHGLEGPFGNPFVIGQKGVKGRMDSINKFKAWVVTQPQIMSRLHELKGKRLGCFCSPLPCHAHVLAELADGDRCECGMCKGLV